MNRCLEDADFPKMPFIMSGISTRFIRENRIIPLEMKDNVLTVVTCEPVDMLKIDALKVAASSDISVCTADINTIDAYIGKYYGNEKQDIHKIIEDIGGRATDAVRDEDEDIGHLRDLASEAPIIKLVNLIIARAIEGRASDVHVEPYSDELRVRYRIDGVLHDVETTPKDLQAAIVSRIKIMARMNIAERRLPQDGRIQVRVNDQETDLRVSTIPVLHGESVVMRILRNKGITIDLALLGFPADTLDTLHTLIRKPNGILLVTGPTGSGKTTTLYGALDKINSPDKKIITVEDPVEYHIKGINQIQVKPQIGLNFANTLRHIVRQDPDIIMIGEIRDLETAEIAIQSALTGHLVFSTLHTNDAPSAMTRLIEMGVEPFLLSSTVRGVLAQRLVRTICPVCRTEESSGINGGDISLLGVPSSTKLFIGKGCEHCSNTGFFGRTGVYELMVVDDEIQRLILRGADANQLREAAVRHGMRTLFQAGTDKVRAGITTLSEILKVTQEA